MKILYKNDNGGDEILCPAEDGLIGTSIAEIAKNLKGVIIDDEQYVEIKRGRETTKNTASISMRQCRLKLLQMNLLETVEAEMQKDKELSIEWEYATEIKIDNPLVLMLSEKLGLTEEAMIKMFEEARLL